MKRFTITRILDGKTDRWMWHNPDPAQSYTERRLAELQNRLLSLYSTAATDLDYKLTEFLHKHQTRYDMYKAQLDAGLITQADFDAWLRGQYFQQRTWELRRGQIARALQDVDRQALDLINDSRLDVFAENANWMLYKIDQSMGLTGTFGLYNREAVGRLLSERPDLLPRVDIDERKSYQRYNDIINECVEQSIVQGENLTQLARRISIETGETALKTLRRDARTAYVSAMNAGSLQCMEDARDKYGIKVQKRWLATLDTHTRDSHALLDGQTVDVDEPFDSLLGKIMYPGDMDADPKNVWNCRCTMCEYFPDYKSDFDRMDAAGRTVGNLTYQQWRQQYGDDGDT